MNRRELARRLRRIERSPIGWRFHDETFTDEYGETWEAHVATSPRGVRRSLNAPRACETVEEWFAFVERDHLRRGLAMPKPVGAASTIASAASPETPSAVSALPDDGGVLSITRSGEPLH